MHRVWRDGASLDMCGVWLYQLWKIHWRTRPQVSITLWGLTINDFSIPYTDLVMEMQHQRLRGYHSFSVMGTIGERESIRILSKIFANFIRKAFNESKIIPCEIYQVIVYKMCMYIF